MAQDYWLGEKVDGWMDSVATLAGVARRHPQTAYTSLQNSLQQEWAFLQHITPDIGMALQVVEYVLRCIFLPSLFQGDTEQLLVRAITGLPVKQARFSLPDPNQTVRENCTASCLITGHLVAALQGTEEFRSGNNSLLVKEEREEREYREEIQRRNAVEAETALGESRDATSKTDALRLGQIQRTGVCLSVPL